MAEGVLVGPMIDGAAYENMCLALASAKNDGGKISGGDRVYADKYPNGYYVRPAIVQIPRQSAVVRQETFAPILYTMKYRNLEEAIAMQNDVSQGLSSCIFSTDVRETEFFLSAVGSDCGIAMLISVLPAPKLAALSAEKKKPAAPGNWFGCLERIYASPTATVTIPVIYRWRRVFVLTLKESLI